MGNIPRTTPPPPDTSLNLSGVAADSKIVGDKINTINQILSSLQTTKITSGDWTCITLDCGIKMCFFRGRYGNTAITRSEGSLYWGYFSKALPAGFFSEHPCVQCQCEVDSGWALQLVLNPNSSTSTLNGWFYTSQPRTVNPYIHIFCIGI